MVFIHGGAFYHGAGSCDEFSPDFLLDENVIVVTINYRLHVFGEWDEIKNVKTYIEIKKKWFYDTELPKSQVIVTTD